MCSRGQALRRWQKCDLITELCLSQAVASARVQPPAEETARLAFVCACTRLDLTESALSGSLAEHAGKIVAYLLAYKTAANVKLKL